MLLPAGQASAWRGRGANAGRSASCAAGWPRHNSQSWAPGGSCSRGRRRGCRDGASRDFDRSGSCRRADYRDREEARLTEGGSAVVVTGTVVCAAGEKGAGSLRQPAPPLLSPPRIDAGRTSDTRRPSSARAGTAGRRQGRSARAPGRGRSPGRLGRSQPVYDNHGRNVSAEIGPNSRRTRGLGGTCSS